MAERVRMVQRNKGTRIGIQGTIKRGGERVRARDRVKKRRRRERETERERKVEEKVGSRRETNKDGGRENFG